MISRFIIGCVLLLSSVHIAVAAATSSEGFRQVVGVIDIRSSHSDGDMTVAALAGLAHSRGIDALILTDHDRMAMEYGVFPFRNLLRYRKQRNAINLGGAEAYLKDIDDAAMRHPEVILIPGVESSPYYYWTGSFFSSDLTANDHEKRLLAIGMNRPEDYRHLPVLHNGPTMRYVKMFLPRIAIFAGALIIGLVLLREKGWRRRTGITLCIVSVFLIFDTKPFRSSPYDPYRGDLGIAPYQRYIDHVEGLGGMTFWNYPETRSGVRRLGPIQVSTPPYPEVLESARGYTGFAALYGDRITVTEPGREWDRVLLLFCRGERNRPAWGISTANFHRERGSGEILGNFSTVFLVREKSKAEILAAMRAGRMYATRGKYPQRPVLEEFSIGDTAASVQATMGETLVLSEAPMIRAVVSSAIDSRDTVTLRLVRSGKLLKTFTGSLPLTIRYRDSGCPRGEKSYYRIDVRARKVGAALSNPIFVSRR